MPGTAEGLALELAAALEPLEQQLQMPKGALALFAEMGLPLPPEVQAAIESGPEVQTIVAEVGLVLAEVPALAAAVAAADSAAIIAAVGRLAPPAGRAFAAVRSLGERARDAFPADLSAFEQEVQGLITALPERLVGWIIVSYLESRRPLLLRTLALVGVLESTAVPAIGGQPAVTRRAIHLDRLITFLGDPAQLLTDIYGWGDVIRAADVRLLLERLDELLTAAELFTVFDPAVPELRALLLTLRPAPVGPPSALDMTLLLQPLTGLDLQLSPADSRTDVRLHSEGSLDTGASLRISPTAGIVPLAAPGAVVGRITLSATRRAPDGDMLLLFGRREGTRLTATAITASASAEFATHGGDVRGVAGLEAAVQNGQVVVSFGGSDGFLSSVLPSMAKFDLDVGVGWSEAEGLRFRGGAGLAFVIPLEVEVGPTRLERLDLAVRATLGATAIVSVEGRIAGGIRLGPFAVSVEGVGAGVDLLFRGVGSDGTPSGGTVDLGPVAVAFRFLPPTGLGLAVDAGPVSGGGFIRFDGPNARYGGILELRLGVVGVQAVALLDTRLHGGRKGYALLVLLRASFPPIQLGFGLALSSVGGLLALNRKVDVDALRNRLASGTAGRILAPEDPVRNAPVLLADLSAVFPPAEGVVVVGPTLQLSWMQIVRFDIGIFIELPGPRRVVIIGSARASIEKPSGGKPYLKIRLDILGELNFAARTASFDAVLIDSHLMEILELSGGAAFRLSWGAEPYVVLTVGGFHPAYNPAPLVFPSSLTRIAMVRGTPSDVLYLRFEGYFAITTNSLQFGASVEAIISLGNFNIRGFLAFDALIQSQPLHFQFAIAASVKVRWKSRNLGGLTLRGEMNGPGPVVFRGRVCFEIMWFDICFSETFRLGSSNPPSITPVSSAVAMLTKQLEDPRNVHGMESMDRWVTVEPAKDAALPVVSPLGQAVWSQHRAPLGLLLQRFDGAPLSHPETVTVSGAQVTGPEPDWFAPGSFTELGDADALNRPAFSRLQAGARLGLAGTHDGPAKDKTVTVRQIRLPLPAVELTAVALPAWLQRATAGRLGNIERDAVTPAIGVRDEAWSLHGGGGVTTGLSQPQAHQLAKLGAAGTAVAAVDTIAALAF